MAIDDAVRARSLIGVPFRPQGRVPERGLDCVGLVLTACGFPTDLVRTDYRLRGNYEAVAVNQLLRHFRPVSKSERRAGDVLFMLAGDDQLHFGVLTDRGFVHADARLRKVVETPGEPDWPVIGIYRRRKR
jgi:cell wall-associated NlpC family hydrolase